MAGNTCRWGKKKKKKDITIGLDIEGGIFEINAL